ncbi:MAG: 50S ribosomal protein L6 [Halobacteriovoraceae bacterium]|nr:50S ribosomal protein L6 [Halobacteriovoraceae bacterium]
MSRIGKNPVVLPDKVEVKINGGEVLAKGPNGQLNFTFPQNVTIEQVGKEIVIKPLNDSKESRSMWGTARTIINNMVTGVSSGFTKSLEFNGVGYKASVNGKELVLNLGYSHPINYELPEGISAKVNKNIIDIIGADKELVGFVAAKVRSFRPPEPYKGKGIKYLNENIIRKAGKTGAKK